MKRSKRRSGKRKASAKFLAAGKAWRSHLSEYRKKHPNLSLKQQMKGAAKTYKKGKSGTVSVKTSKYSVRVRPRRTKKSKGSRSKRRRSRKALFNF
tara:strand:+ start:132 stop:419 length:288 start_codon:yes stop_codon:yes gene_type:complete